MLAAALLFTCLPAHVVRGEMVRCEARFEPPTRFTIVELSAEAEGHLLRDVAAKPTTERYVWAGPAAVDTSVKLTARSSDGRVYRATSVFSVAPRHLPRLRLPETPPSWEYGPAGALGLTTVTLAMPQPRYIDEGPNARWFIVEGPVPQPSARVIVSPKLGPDGKLDCEPADVASLREGILKHEGAVASSGPSHYAESRRAFEERDLQAEVEQMHVFYDDAVRGPPLHQRVATKLRAFLDGMTIAQWTSVDAAAAVPTRCSGVLR